MTSDSDSDIFAPPPPSEVAAPLPPQSGDPRRRRRIYALAAAGLLLALPPFLFYRYDRADIFRALPGRTVAAAYLRSMAAEEKAALKHPVVREAIAAFGADPDETLEDNSGLYWTLFWLTGEHSCLGVVPRAGECGGIGAYLAGASWTGWKARALEFLWRVKWVPGLGRLKTTARGTRYMEFPHARELRDNGIVLGLDIVRGTLVAVLAQDPDLVLELSARLSDTETPPLAGCFAPVSPTPPGVAAPPPWEQVARRHRVWLDVGAAASAAAKGFPDAATATGLPFLFDAGTATLDLTSFSEPGMDAALSFCSPSLDAALPAATNAAALPPPPWCEGTFLAASFASRPLLSPPRISAAGIEVPEAAGEWSGFGFAAVSGAPVAAHLAIVQVPAFEVSLPVADAYPALDAWWPGFFAGAKDGFGSFGRSLREKSPVPGVRLLRSKNMEPLGRTPDADCAFVDQSAPGRISFGLGWKAHSELRSGGGVSVGGALAVAKVDFPRLGDEWRALAAVTRLAGAFGMRLEQGDAERLSIGAMALDAVRGLGVSDLILRRAATGPFVLEFRTEP